MMKIIKTILRFETILRLKDGIMRLRDKMRLGDCLRLCLLISVYLLISIIPAAARDIVQATSANVMVFMTDSTSHITGREGISDLAVTASKNGGAFAAISPTITERGNGWYNIALTTAHTDTLGDLALHITGTAADPTDLKITIIKSVWDYDVSAYSAAGLAGSFLKGAGSAGDPWISNLNDYPEGTAGYTIARNTAPSFVLPAIQGHVYTAIATQQRRVTIVQGDTPRLTFDLASDYTGWTIRFGAKVAPGQAYAIGPVNGSWSVAATGKGYIDLSAANTATAGTYKAEIEILNGASVMTAIKFDLTIIPQVVVPVTP